LRGMRARIPLCSPQREDSCMCRPPCCQRTARWASTHPLFGSTRIHTGRSGRTARRRQVRPTCTCQAGCLSRGSKCSSRRRSSRLRSHHKYRRDSPYSCTSHTPTGWRCSTFPRRRSRRCSHLCTLRCFRCRNSPHSTRCSGWCSRHVQDEERVALARCSSRTRCSGIRCPLNQNLNRTRNRRHSTHTGFHSCQS